MSMQDDYVQTQDFNLRLLYLVALSIILATVLVSNVVVLLSLHKGALQTSNLPLRILLSVKLLCSLLYVLLDCTRNITYLATYTNEAVLVETYVGCGVYYWLTSSAQWMVSFMLVWTTLKRILNVRYERLHTAWVHPRTSIVLVVLSAIFAFGPNSHYFLEKSQTVDFSVGMSNHKYGINGTVEICMPEPGSSYMTFWRDTWPMLDALFHIVLPTIVWLPIQAAIELHFYQDEEMLAKLNPKDRIKVIYNRKRDKAFITNLGWTRAVLYAGLVYTISNLPLNIYLWHYEYDKFFVILYFNEKWTLSTLLAFELLKYAPHLLWLPIYTLTGCDGRKVVAKKSFSEHALPVGGSHYSLRSRSTEEARARPSRSTENRI